MSRFLKRGQLIVTFVVLLFLLSVIVSAEKSYLYLVRPDGTMLKRGVLVSSNGHQKITSTYTDYSMEGQYYWCFGPRCWGVNPASAPSSGSFGKKKGCVCVNAYNVNYDYNAEQCKAQFGDKAWVDSVELTYDNKCCGDDVDDEGFVNPGKDVSYQFICIKEGSTYAWHNAITDKACIYNVEGKFDVISDGTKWYACLANHYTPKAFKSPGQTLDSLYQVYPSGKFSSICYNNNGHGTFARCIIGRTCGNSGETHRIGDKLDILAYHFYCSNSFTWEYDLECDYETCEKAGLSYTGSKCCGEDDQDTYNDMNIGTWTNPGGCIYGKYVPSDSSTSEQGIDVPYDLVNYKGWFYSCNMPDLNTYQQKEDSFVVQYS